MFHEIYQWVALHGDLVTGIWEIGGTVFTGFSIFDVIRDKEVKGVSWVQILYFAVFGAWNVLFFPSQGLFYSFLGGVVLTLFNTIYMLLLVYYLKYYDKNLY